MNLHFEQLRFHLVVFADFGFKIHTFLSYWYENPNPKSMKITTKRQRQRGVTVSITFLKQPGHWSDIIRANWKERINDCFQRWIRWNRQMVPHLLDSYHGYHGHGTRKVPINYSVGILTHSFTHWLFRILNHSNTSRAVHAGLKAAEDLLYQPMWLLNN